MKIPYLHSLFEFISGTSIAGIPLDILAHLGVSFLLVLVFIKMKLSHWQILATLLFLAITKEVYDLPRLSSSAPEHIKDIIVSMIIPIIYVLIVRERRPESQYRENYS